MFISTHQAGSYPNTGKASEVGTGRGEGFTINLPLPGKKRPRGNGGRGGTGRNSVRPAIGGLPLPSPPQVTRAMRPCWRRWRRWWSLHLGASNRTSS